VVGGGFMAIAAAMAQEREKALREQSEKKWWQVWKLFSKD
jgi:hypothetical protein